MTHRIDGVEDRVENSGDADNAEQPASDNDMWLGEDEQKADDEKRNNVLQVVEMRPPTPLDVFVCLHFETFAETTVFGVAHRLRTIERQTHDSRVDSRPNTHKVLATMVNRQHRHQQRFHNQDTAPGDVDPKQIVIGIQNVEHCHREKLNANW